MTTEKSAADIWDEALEAARKTLDGALEYGGAHGQRQRRPSNFGRAAEFVAKIPNPYHNSGIPARESEEWKELVLRSEKLGEAVALFQNAKDAYVAVYPKDRQ